MADIQKIETISIFHKTRGLPEPEHPLVSIVNYADVHVDPEYLDKSWTFDFYCIALKRNIPGKFRYGQNQYDFDEGVMFFIAPGQVFSIARGAHDVPEKSGWMLLIHPDFFWNSTLAKNIKKYQYFDYATNEALFLSKKEEDNIMVIIESIRQEYHSNIDTFSQNIIISQIETLLNYSDRFYNRQFITRKINTHKIINRFEDILNSYFNSEDLILKGLPQVNNIADSLNLSMSYLRSSLKIITGKSPQQLIHEKLIEKAKEKLTTTNLSVCEVAYDLGFEHSQSFSKLFKTKTNLTPSEFRQKFN